MVMDTIPVVDLRLLSHAELTSLSRSSPSAFDLRRCDDVVVPRIDRSVFNESAGSRKQTYSRLRLASRAPDPSHSPQPPPVREPDHDHELILSSLRRLFAARDASSQTLPPPSSQTQNLADEREVLNEKGVTVDFVAFAEKVDPFGEEMRRRTDGLSTVEGLLGFLTGLDGQWGSRRKKKKIVDASWFGDHLPRGWRLLIGIKRREGVVRLGCRRYISPSGKRFKSCKDVSSYMLSLIGSQDTRQLISLQNNEAYSSLVNFTYEYDENREERPGHASVRDISSSSADHQKQIVLYNPVEQEKAATNRCILECRRCNLSFTDAEEYLQHLLTFHQRSAKRRKLIKTVGDGVIIKDGKFECQFCHKTFTERRRYNGHVGSHVRYQGVSAGVLQDDINLVRTPSSLIMVPCVWSADDVSVIRNGKSHEVETFSPKHADVLQLTSSVPVPRNDKSSELESCTPEHPDDRQLTSSNSKLETGNQGSCYATESTLEARSSKSIEDQNESHVTSKVTFECSDAIAFSCATENQSPKCLVGVSTGRSVDIQVNVCDETADELEQKVEAAISMAIRPIASSGMMLSSVGALDASYEKNNRKGISSFASTSADDQGYGCDISISKSEELIESANISGVESYPCIVGQPQCLPAEENLASKTPTEEDLGPSCMISEIDKCSAQQKMDSGCNLSDLPSRTSCVDVETHADGGLTGAFGEHVLSETVVRESGSDFGSTDLAVKGADMDESMQDDLHVNSEQGINLNCAVPSSFCHGHNEGIGTDLDFALHNKMEPVVNDTDNYGPDLEMCFRTSNAESDKDTVCHTLHNDNVANAMQFNLTNMSLSWLPASSELPNLDMFPDQSKRSCAGKKHENMSGFEGLRDGRIEPSDFVLFTGQPAMELDYVAGLDDRRDLPIQLQWDEPLPAEVNSCRFTTVCVWCGGGFDVEGTDADLRSESMGFMCPACKAKIPC